MIIPGSREQKARIKKLLSFLPDTVYIRLLYRIHFGRKLDLKDPKTFNEKIQWLKLYDRKPLYSSLVDKYEVKKYVTERIGEEYIVPVYGIWNSFDEIDFDKLPEQFVLKCTHDSGGIFICRDKKVIDVEEAKGILNKCLKNNYFYASREWPYKNIKPKIMAEKYLENSASSGELTDYKFMCFGGRVKLIFTCTERFTSSGLKVTFFDTDWNKLPFERHYPMSNEKIDKPERLSDMISLAEKLSKGFSFLRVDFYEADHRIYLGELTLYPGSGFEEFTPSEWDRVIGDWLLLPKG